MEKLIYTPNKIEEIVRKVKEIVKKKYKPIAIIHFGSSLNPKDMMIESDIDLMAILKRRYKSSIEVFCFDSIEVCVHLVSKKDFEESVKIGFPLVLMAVKFGKQIYGPKRFLEKYKEKANATQKTFEIWYDNAWRVFHFAVLDYVCTTCPGCYLRDCHHAARSFLRAFILRREGAICQRDEEILSRLPVKIQKLYRRLIEIRKNGEKFSFKPKLNRKASSLFKDREAHPLLLLEKIIRFVVKEIEGKDVKSLKDIAKGLKGEITSISIQKTGEVFILKGRKILKRKLFKE